MKTKTVIDKYSVKFALDDFHADFNSTLSVAKLIKKHEKRLRMFLKEYLAAAEDFKNEIGN